MRERIIPIGEGFWNIRGTFRFRGLLDIGTHASLVRRANGRFVLLDAYALSPELRGQIDGLTNGGRDVEAVLNLHPFHTVHVKGTHQAFPDAKLYGTARHRARFPELPWQAASIEDPATQALFAPDLEFSVPRGVELVPADETVHFSSVLAMHPASRTMHVDDTFMYATLPFPLRLAAPDGLLRMHPTLAKALERRPGAARDFRQWADEIVERSRTIDHLCAAHTSKLTAKPAGEGAAVLSKRLREALDRVEPILRAHEQNHG